MKTRVSLVSTLCASVLYLTGMKFLCRDIYSITFYLEWFVSDKAYCKMNRALRLPLSLPTNQDSPHQNSSLCLESAFMEVVEGEPRVPIKKVAQLCPTLCDPMDYNPPGSSVHRLLQARTLEWVAISFSSGSSWPRDGTHISCIGRQVLHH